MGGQMDELERPRLATTDLLAHADWLRRLARHLVADDATAEDGVQEVYLAALRSPPDPERPARPWLAQVLRNALRSVKRSSRRRHGREQVLGAMAEAPPSAEEVLARTQLQQRLAELLSALEEPYRAMLLLR